MEYKVEIGGTTYEMKDLKSVHIIQPLFDSFSAGNACSAELDITFWPLGDIARMATIIPYYRETAEDAWQQLGIFYTDTRSQYRQTTEIVAYDAMLKGDIEWIPDQTLEFPMSVPDAVSHIAARMGVEVDSRTVLNAAYTIDYPANGDTLRNVLQYIAAAHAGNWIITAEGKLLLIPLFSSLPEETHYLVTENGTPITFGGTRILI